MMLFLPVVQKGLEQLEAAKNCNTGMSKLWAASSTDLADSRHQNVDIASLRFQIKYHASCMLADPFVHACNDDTG